MIYVGIDVGGTGIQVGLVDESGKIPARIFPSTCR